MRRINPGDPPLKGHGALSNPPGRFDLTKVESVDDGWYLQDSQELPETTLQPERAKSVISRNDSPDIPFEQSINPYRGCAHACPYCMSPATPVLAANGRTITLSELRPGDEILGTRRVGRYLRYVRSRVLARWSVIKPAFRTTLEDGTELVSSGDHRYLTDRGWKFVSQGRSGKQRPHLTSLNKLMGTGAFALASPQNEDYRKGYLCGMLRGDGNLREFHEARKDGSSALACRFRLALCDLEALVRARNYLLDFDIATNGRVFQVAFGNCRAMQLIETGRIRRVEAIYRLIAWPPHATREWSAGFLAGIFDAEGSYSRGILRISNTDATIIARTTACLREFGFDSVTDYSDYEHRKPVSAVRVRGGLREHLRFFHTVCPAITRKLNIEGRALKSQARLRVVAVEPLGAMRLCDITTETQDFIANGVVSHNCYARPSHAYMDLSPGLDFETKLFYKQDAAQVLERELSRPGYVVKPIMLGANTDPYQPVERRMRVTRSILEVLTRARHPVMVTTKGALVMRDLDLLADLARDGLASVAISIPTLDPQLKRVLEPQAASPQAKLRALASLTAAGVSCGVMVAPIIPALTDHEIEAILAAAHAAGAQWASYSLLRLPYEVKDLFREWLAAHYPERAAHVMSLVRGMRGGRDNDPEFGSRMHGTGAYAQLLRSRFHGACRRLNFPNTPQRTLSTAHFRAPGGATSQLGLDFAD